MYLEIKGLIKAKMIKLSLDPLLAEHVASAVHLPKHLQHLPCLPQQHSREQEPRAVDPPHRPEPGVPLRECPPDPRTGSATTRCQSEVKLVVPRGEEAPDGSPPTHS